MRCPSHSPSLALLHTGTLDTTTFTRSFYTTSCVHPTNLSYPYLSLKLPSQSTPTASSQEGGGGNGKIVPIDLTPPIHSLSSPKKEISPSSRELVRSSASSHENGNQLHAFFVNDGINKGDNFKGHTPKASSSMQLFLQLFCSPRTLSFTTAATPTANNNDALSPTNSRPTMDQRGCGPFMMSSERSRRLTIVFNF
jgi:hypothetical protein